MSYNFTYPNLVEFIQQEVNRYDDVFTQNIPAFITLAQTRIARELKILGLKTVSVDTLVPNAPIVSKPNEWLNGSEMYIGINATPADTMYSTYVPLLKRSYDFCRIYWPNPTLTGQPKYYCEDYNYGVWLFAPTPDLPYPYEATWYGFPASLDDVQQTNFLTQFDPDVLSYGGIVEAGIFVEDERLPIWTKKYEEAKNNLSEEDRRRIYDGYGMRGG